jgi:integrase
MDLWDTLLPGFGLRISSGGTRTYIAMRRVNGRLVRRTLGQHPPLHVGKDDLLRAGEFWVAEAREKARLVLADLARGIDAAATPVLANPGKTTFGTVAAMYFADPSKRGGAVLRSKSELERKVRVDLATWKDRPVAEITKADVRALISAKHATSPVSANRLLALVRRILRWAAREDLIPANPALEIDKPAQEGERDRVLTMAELAQVWHAAGQMGAPYEQVIKTLILTGQRRGEVAQLRPEEIDGTSWRLPDARAKRGKGHLIPLSPLAVKILDATPRIGDGQWVFSTGRRQPAKDGKKPTATAPVSGWSRMKDRLDRVIAEAAAKAADEPLDLKRHALADWTLHDIRRSVGTHLRDGDVMGAARADRLLVSKILNHAEGGVTRLYDRYSSDPEKRAALDAWAKAVERKVGLNVVPLKKKS